jgi:cardiolipin synthase A/B
VIEEPAGREPTDLTPAPQTLLATIARYARSTYRLRRGNAVKVLQAGRESFPAMMRAIAGARRTIVLETYIFEDDATGARFIDALIERAKAGVVVRVIYDAIGSFFLRSASATRMRAGGVRVIEYHPVAPWRKRFNLSRRDHRKILVVDDEVAFAGGINLSDDYADLADGGRGWHDVHCELRGPVVADLARLFRRTWLGEGGDVYPAPPSAEEHPINAMNLPVRVVDNAKVRRRGAIRRAYLTAFKAARRSILIENAYFLPEYRLRLSLARAVRRGVEVAIIVPGSSDVKPIEYAGLFGYRWLTKRGVRLLRWKGPMMHAKTVVVDGTWLTIGSYNFDARSLRYNLEVVVEVIDEQIGHQMERQFHFDELETVPYDEAAWKRLSWWKKAVAWLAFKFRTWM